MLHAGIDFDFLFTGNESLITRARNTSASRFLDTRFEYLMFIDADIQFASEDVKDLWNLGEEVCCGAYAMKRKDRAVSAWKDGKLVDLGDFDGPTEVDYAGTGFLMIHRSVFERMKPMVTTFVEGTPPLPCWGFFDLMQKDDIQLSEDYSFCERWRSLGGKIMLEPSIKLIHWGQYGY